MSRKMPLDRFTWFLMLMLLLASLVPARGMAAPVFSQLTNVAIGGLFFLHGLNLSRREVLAGMGHWRLHVWVFTSTYVMFPLLGISLKPLLEPLVGAEIYTGVLFMCMVSSAVQSSIAMTSMAHGNVPAAICSASASNMLGVFLTPLLVAIFMGERTGGISFTAFMDVMVLILLPFVVGLVVQRWLGVWVKRYPLAIKLFDQGSILLIVYTAFSASVVSGLWQRTPLNLVVGLVLVCALFLGLGLVINTLMARILGFNKQDEIAIVFCGSKKSLAAGAPMAKVIFASAGFGTMILPVMIYNQMQIIVCALIARHYARYGEVNLQAQAEQANKFSN